MRGDLSLSGRSIMLYPVIRPRTPRPLAVLRRTATIGLVAGLLLGCAACSGDDDPSEATASSAAPTSPPKTATPPRLTRPEATWQVSLEQLRGGVERQRRPAITKAIQRSLAHWVDGGFRGDYPRSAFASAFATWTPQAARMGRVDRDITTNGALGPELVQVVADRLEARLYVFATRGLTGGATAKVFLRFTAVRDTGALARITVKGDLALTRIGSRWHVFGYDLDRIVGAR
jgi:hypothetical protein